VADVYATTPLLPVPASLSTQSPWAPQRPAQERKNAGHGLAITVTASSARHLAPQGATQSAGPRLVGTGTAAGWQRSSQAPSNAYGDAATGGLAPSEPRNGSFHKGAPNKGAPNDARAGAAPRVARVASALPGPEAAAPGTGWHLEQEYPGSAREHAYAQADSDDLDAARQNGGWLERGPDSREQREARRRRALMLREQGWARKDIAAALGVSRSTVSYWFRREFLREREEGMSQDELLESDTDAQARAAFATDSVSSDDGAQADQLFPRAQSHGESQAPERAYAERASVTANR
ncbi:MAG TPA: helix-turn-helix domain-containing protein, partial [Ktedonobacterales bacterium]